MQPDWEGILADTQARIKKYEDKTQKDIGNYDLLSYQSDKKLEKFLLQNRRKNGRRHN